MRVDIHFLPLTTAPIIEALKDYPEEAEIVLWRWTDEGSKRYYLSPTCGNDPVEKPQRYEVLVAYRIEEE